MTVINLRINRMAPKLVTASKKPAQPPVQAFRSPEAQFRDAVVLLHRVKGLEVEIANIQRDLMSSEDEDERIELFAGFRETWEKHSQLNLQFQRLPASLRDKAVNQQDDEAQEMLASNLAWSKAYQHAESAADEEGEVLTTEELDLVATIGVGSGAFGVAFNPATSGTYAGDAYVTNSAGASVSVIDPTGAVVATITVGSFPRWVAFNPATTGTYAGDAYVTNGNSGNVSVIDPTTNTVVATLGVATSPFGLAFAP